MNDGNKVHYAFLKPKTETPLATVFICHGQGGNLNTWSPILVPFARNGYQAFIFDYQGYGKCNR